jgi:phosphoribosylamine--glycine ligase
LGSGAREHAIVKGLIRTGTPATNIIVAPGNAGIAQEVHCAALNANDPIAVTSYAVEQAIELAIIGP